MRTRSEPDHSLCIPKCVDCVGNAACLSSRVLWPQITKGFGLLLALIGGWTILGEAAALAAAGPAELTIEA